jgi:hypothetical protein
MHPDMLDSGLGEMLAGQAMAEICRRFVQAVSVSITTPSREATRLLEMLRGFGYRPTSSRLSLHCWPRRTEWSQAYDWHAA